MSQLGERSFDPFAEQPQAAQEPTPAEQNNASPRTPPPAGAPTPATPAQPNALREPDWQPFSTPPPSPAANAPVRQPSADEAPPALPFEVQPAEPSKPQTLPNPQDGLLRDPADGPCQQVYNGHDCCKTDATCRQAHRRLESTSIRQVKLDITPRFKPNVGVLRSEQDEQYAASMVARERAFEQLPTREWRDKTGALLTTGRFVDFVSGRILIETTAGEIVRIPYTELSADDNCFVTGWWQIPGECPLQTTDQPGRNWLASTVTWKASALCHKPLYFEQVQLERYGHSAGVIKQPILSGAHFFVNIATLPYKMGIHPPRMPIRFGLLPPRQLCTVADSPRTAQCPWSVGSNSSRGWRNLPVTLSLVTVRRHPTSAYMCVKLSMKM